MANRIPMPLRFGEQPFATHFGKHAPKHKCAAQRRSSPAVGCPTHGRCYPAASCTAQGCFILAASCVVRIVLARPPVTQPRGVFQTSCQVRGPGLF